jgi:XTP/dITP diphosphohydrolase
MDGPAGGMRRLGAGKTPMKLVAATLNAGKLREFQRLLRDLPLDIIGLTDMPGLSLPSETGTRYIDNAALKARAAVKALGLPAFGDDTGLEVDALGGRPGLRSARYASPDGNAEKNIDRLLRELRGVPEPKRTARFRAWLVLVYPSGAGTWLEEAFEGVFEGAIAQRPSGRGGFGYDPLFISPAHGRTVAELTDDEKDAVSHRGHAARKMADFLGARLK